MHYPITMGALEAGLHVMCEKATALNADQARQMHEAAEAARVVNMVGYSWRWVPPFNYAHHLIEQGYIGHCHRAFPIPARQCIRPSYKWQIDPAQGHGILGTQIPARQCIRPSYKWQIDPAQGHGILGTLGSHMIDFARWYVGDIAQISGHLTSFVERQGPEGGVPFTSASDSALIAIEFAEGSQGTICVSGVTLSLNAGTTSRSGSTETPARWKSTSTSPARGCAGCKRVRKSGITFRLPWSSWDRGRIPPLAGLDSFAPFTNQSVGDRIFIDGITSGKPLEPTFYDGWTAQQAIDATLASHDEGRWITIS